MKPEFYEQISENIPISNLMKIRPVRAELFHAGGRTGKPTNTTQLVVVFHNFANPPKTLYSSVRKYYEKYVLH